MSKQEQELRDARRFLRGGSLDLYIAALKCRTMDEFLEGEKDEQ